MSINKEKLREVIPVAEYYRDQLGEPQGNVAGKQKYFCPFHPDKKTPNMVADEKGYYCFACEEGGDIFKFHGKRHNLSFSDTLKYFMGKYAPHLSGNGNGHHRSNGNEPKAGTQPNIDDVRKAVGENWLVKKHKASGYTPTGLYEYKCHISGLKYWRIRMDHPDPETNKKWIAPFSFIDGKWELKEPPFPNGKPLYKSSNCSGSNNPVYVFEGEKMVDAAEKFGLNAVTSGGSTSAGSANWEQLQGREVVIWPDNNEPGIKYAGAVTEKLLAIDCQVKQIDVEKLNLPVGGDICDWLDINSEASKEDVESLPSKSIIQKEENKIIPFPVPSNGTGLNEAMESAGISALPENSDPDEIIEAISKFSAITANRDVVFLGIARSELIKKLKAIGVQSPAGMVKDALKPPKSKTVEGQGQTLSFENPEPWFSEVDGAELLAEISDTIKRYVFLPKGGETALSLWALFAWTHDAFQVSPLLDFRSPLKRCGKTTGLKVVKRLVPKPLIATNVSTPSLFRGIEAYRPTLLIDEVDTFLNRDQETNGILNGGHERDGAFVLRCEGDNHEPRLFSVWCPKVLSGIGKRKDTLDDRSISIPMKRKGPGQNVEKLLINGGDNFLPLRQKMARWSDDNLEELRGATPEIPESLNDRAQDNWFPLLAIADLCGDEWSKKAREAALTLSGDDNQDEDAWGVQLLSDIRDYFKEQNTDRVSSEDLVKHLPTLEDRDWLEMGKSGRVITKRRISKILKPFDVKSKTIRLDSGTTAKGYTEEMLEDAFFHYLRDTPIPNVTSVTSLSNKELGDFQNVTNHPNVTDEKQPNLFKNNNVTNVTDKNEGMEEEKINETPSHENGWNKVFPVEGEPFWRKGRVEVPVCGK